MSLFSDILFDVRTAAESLAALVGTPTLRLGVTGLSRAGKTVFIVALVDHLTRVAMVRQRGQKTPLPVFRVVAEGRLKSGRLEPQPDDAVPRFAVEEHLAALAGGNDGNDRLWPQSTRRISELRLRLDFERPGGFRGGPASLILDIVDYPGEWLLDLPLLDKSYAQWAGETWEASQSAARATLAADWRGFTAGLDPLGPADEETGRRASELFTAYLRACRADTHALSTLPPGRFLMPGDLEGSPALTFAPLHLGAGAALPPGSLAAMMARRYEAYKAHVVRPFFRDHFARLDRQIVLVDALAAMNAGAAAVRDLETALAEVLVAFRVGRTNLVSNLVRPKIDKILFAATKADHLHHTSHDRLEAILRFLTARAMARAETSGAAVDVVALAGIRATREARIGAAGAELDAVIGTPLAGERLGDETFDGLGEAAIFPGDLPMDPARVLRAQTTAAAGADYRFVRFRPPRLARGDDGVRLLAPHIRLDRALQFLLGDKLA